MEKLLTIAQISQQLSIPESTLRYRAKLFTDFFPTRGDGRKKRFLPICVERFQFVDTLFNKGLIAEDIRAELGERYGQDAESATDATALNEDRWSPAPVQPNAHASEKELQEILEPMVKMIENQETIIEELKRQNKMLADPTVGTDKKTLARVFG